MADLDKAKMSIGPRLLIETFVTTFSAAWPSISSNGAMISFFILILSLASGSTASLLFLGDFNRDDRVHLGLPVLSDLALGEAGFRLPEGITNSYFFTKNLITAHFLNFEFNASTAALSAPMSTND